LSLSRRCHLATSLPQGFLVVRRRSIPDQVQPYLEIRRRQAQERGRILLQRPLARQDFRGARRCHRDVWRGQRRGWAYRVEQLEERGKGVVQGRGGRDLAQVGRARQGDPRTQDRVQECR
jgi:hypothetical protein